MYLPSSVDEVRGGEKISLGIKAFDEFGGGALFRNLWSSKYICFNVLLNLELKLKFRKTHETNTMITVFYF